MISRYAMVVLAAILMLPLSASAQQRAERFVTDTLTVSMLKAQFNKDAGTPRLILLLSPTCPLCRKGADAVQSGLLKQYPKQPLKVYVVWQPILEYDNLAAAKTEQTRFNDERVTHFWDGKRNIGIWFTTEGTVQYKGAVMWDAYYLYGADAVWKDRPDHLLGSGRPVEPMMPRLLKLIAALHTPS